jgi:hypothetical protein
MHCIGSETFFFLDLYVGCIIENPRYLSQYLYLQENLRTHAVEPVGNDRNRCAVGWKGLIISVLLSTYLCKYNTINYEIVVLHIVNEFNYVERGEENKIQGNYYTGRRSSTIHHCGMAVCLIVQRVRGLGRPQVGVQVGLQAPMGLPVRLPNFVYRI